MLARRYFRRLRARPVRVVFTDGARLRLRFKARDEAALRLPRLFEAAPEPVLASLARLAFGRGRPSDARRDRRLLRGFVQANEAARRGVGGERLTGPRGRYHDLDRIYARLNRRFFGGRVRCEVTWSSRPARSFLGTWEPRRGGKSLITVNCLLDHPGVPPYYVEFILYHEMLHELYPQPIRGGRTLFHPPEYRRAERAFPRFAQADAWEKRRLDAVIFRKTPAGRS